MQAVDLASIVGTGAATWWSPGYDNQFKPQAELLAMRVLKKEDKLPQLKNAWLSRLCFPRILVRRVGTIDWSLSLGDLCGTIAKVWPVSWKSMCWQPDQTEHTVAETIVITDITEWESMPIKPISPLHAAIRAELGVLKASCHDTSVKLREDVFYKDLAIGAVGLDKERPIAETWVRQGCPNATLAYMIELALHIPDCQLHGRSMFAVLTSLAQALINPLDPQLLAEIYVLKGVVMEPTEDLDSLLEFEFVLDVFDETERKNMEAEIKSAKSFKAEHAQYKRDYKKWKVV